MPSVVAILAGNTVGNLKELKQCTIPASCQEFVLLNAQTEVCMECHQLSGVYNGC